MNTLNYLILNTLYTCAALSTILFTFNSQTLFGTDKPQNAVAPPLEENPSSNATCPTDNFILNKDTITTAIGPLSFTPYRGFVTVDGTNNQQKAKIHYIAYIKEPKEASRPILFCFNGGPGSSSVWLHLGLLGPYHIETDDLDYQTAPYTLCANKQSPLAYADLIFIDPVSTGFSEPNSKEEANEFLGVDEDISSCSQCIRDLLSRYGRWNSPIYLVGESYGALRAIGIASALKDSYMLDISGIITISPAIDLESLDPYSTLSQICALPTYALLAQYYNACAEEHINKPTQDLFNEVCDFGRTALLPLLIQGSASNKDSCLKIAQKLSGYIGIPTEVILAHHLKIPPHRFQKLLLKSENRRIGRFDGRISVPMIHDASNQSHDPSLDRIASRFTALMMQHLQNKLGWDGKGVYTTLAFIPWNWKNKSLEAGFGYLSYTDKLQSLMSRCPDLKIFAASGLYDLATPSYSQQYTLDQVYIDQQSNQNPPEPKESFTHRKVIKQYLGGHMMYLSPRIREQLLTDIQYFIQNSNK